MALTAPDGKMRPATICHGGSITDTTHAMAALFLRAYVTRARGWTRAWAGGGGGREAVTVHHSNQKGQKGRELRPLDFLRIGRGAAR